MGLINKLANIDKYERFANGELGHSISSRGMANMFGTGGDAINVLEEYNGFAWKAINIRATMLSAEDLFVERMVAKKWQLDEMHPFNFVMEGSEGQRDLSELLEAHSKSMDLYGEAFWYFSKGETNRKPMGIYLLDPSAMTVLVAADRVTGYVYQKDGNRVSFDLDEILHRKNEDPRSPFRGYGPMQAAGWFVRSTRYTYTYVNNLLENNAIPAGVVVAKSQVNDADWELFKTEWKSKYTGTANAGKTAFIRGQDLDFVKTGLSLGEIDVEKIKNSNRDDIMVMFGISKPMMAIFDDINRASATVAKQLFAMTYTKPELRALTRKLTKKVNSWYGKDYRVSSTNPVPEDDDAKLEQYDKGVGRWFTVNEARAAYGKDPVEGGDVLEADKAPVAAPKSIGKITIRTKNNKAELSYEMKESFRSAKQDIEDKYEKKFYQAAQPVLKEQKERVLDQLKPKKVIDAHFDVEEETQALAKALLPLFIDLAKEQGKAAAVFAGNADTPFELTAVMETYIKDSVVKATRGFTDETQAKIVQALTEGLEAGESVAAIGKRIGGIYEDILGVKTPGARTERLARTEVIKASNEITEAAYKQSGVVKKKEWFANPGHCEFCASLNGSVISLGATFVPVNSRIDGDNGGTRVNTYEDVNHPPVHPQCRCTLIPVIEG